MGQLDPKGVKDSASASNIRILYEPGSLITRQRMTFQHFTLSRLAMFRLSNCKSLGCQIARRQSLSNWHMSSNSVKVKTSLFSWLKDILHGIYGPVRKPHGKLARSKAYLYAEHVEPADMELTLDLALSSDARKNLEYLDHSPTSFEFHVLTIQVALLAWYSIIFLKADPKKADQSFYVFWGSAMFGSSKSLIVEATVCFGSEPWFAVWQQFRSIKMFWDPEAHDDPGSFLHDFIWLYL